MFFETIPDMEQSPVLYCFLSDLFHQILFYFGGIVAMAILLWEKGTDRPMQWRWVSAFFLFCVFVACFQGFVDEHHNTQTLIEEKARLVSDNSQLGLKLDAKQSEIDYLRDHQHVEINGSSADPRIGDILERLNGEEKALKEQPVKSIKKGLVSVAKEMLDTLNQEKSKADQEEDQEEQARMAEQQTPAFRAATAEQRQAIWNQERQQTLAAWTQMEANLRGAMMGQYSPRTVALLEQLATTGQGDVSEKEIQDATRICTIGTAGSAYWGIQMCAQKIAVITQKMR
jgi:hypothetical protein